ncbi:hypothetical protein KORDIASMS9_01435 [Kordia sp. SMS9]|nr:hypothetical protein KORDIASMS9_01435 [Kordia sp. SMS9]
MIDGTLSNEEIQEITTLHHHLLKLTTCQFERSREQLRIYNFKEISTALDLTFITFFF